MADAILADTMTRTLKTLLLWLLLAVLPLHAATAAMPMSCAPVHHQAMPEAWQDVLHDEHASSPSDEHAYHGQHHETAQTPAADTADEPSSNGQAHAGCSACSAGCIGAAAPPPILQSTFAFGGSEAILVSPAPLIPRHAPGGLDRPPRSMII